MLFTFKIFLLACVHDGRANALSCIEIRGLFLCGIDSSLPALLQSSLVIAVITKFM